MRLSHVRLIEDMPSMLCSTIVILRLARMTRSPDASRLARSQEKNDRTDVPLDALGEDSDPQSASYME